MRCHDLKTLIPSFPPPGGTVGLRPAIDAIPGTRPGRCVRRYVGATPPPLAKLRSCVATLRSLRRRTPPALLAPLPLLVVPLPAGIQSFGRWRGRNSPHHQPIRRKPSLAGGLPWPGSLLRLPWLRAKAQDSRESRPLRACLVRGYAGAGQPAGARAWAAVGGKSSSCLGCPPPLARAHPGRPSSTALLPVSGRCLPGGSGLSRPLQASSPPPPTTRAPSGRAGAAPGPPVRMPPSWLELRAVPGLGGHGLENLLAHRNAVPACAGQSPGARAAVAPGSASASLPWALPGTHRRAPPPSVQHGAPGTRVGLAGPGVRACPGSRCRPPCLVLRAVLAWVVGRPLEGLPLADSSVRRVVPPAALRSSLRADLLPRSRSCAALRSLRRRTRPPFLTPGGRLCRCPWPRLRLGWPRGRYRPHGQPLRIAVPGRAGVLPGVHPAPSLAPGHDLKILILPPAPRWGEWPGPKVRVCVAESHPPPVPWGGVPPVGESCASYASASSSAAAPRAMRPAGAISCSGLRLCLLRGRNSPPNRPRI